jgi:hypothetical protein
LKSFVILDKTLLSTGCRKTCSRSNFACQGIFGRGVPHRKTWTGGTNGKRSEAATARLHGEICKGVLCKPSWVWERRPAFLLKDVIKDLSVILIVLEEEKDLISVLLSEFRMEIESRYYHDDTELTEVLDLGKKLVAE